MLSIKVTYFFSVNVISSSYKATLALLGTCLCIKRATEGEVGVGDLGDN